MFVLNIWRGDEATEWHSDKLLTSVRDDNDPAVQLLQRALNLRISGLFAQPPTLVTGPSVDDRFL